MQKCFKKCIKISSKKGQKVAKSENDKSSNGAKKLHFFSLKGQKGDKRDYENVSAKKC